MMKTLTEFLAEHPDDILRIMRTPLPTDITAKYDAVSITPQFRKQLALMEAFNNYMLSMTEGRLTTDDRIQDMIDHSLGELKFKVEVE
jgi:hypothetical protein